MLPLIIKHIPKKSEDIIGQDKGINELKNFLRNFPKNRKKALLVYGPTGVGKTSSIVALANEMGLELFEVNASDVRNKEQIETKVGAAANQQSLFTRGKIILIDEIDGLSGTNDRGGVQALVKIIENSSFPIILTALNPWDYKLNSIRNKSIMVEFAPLDFNSIFKILKRISIKEKVICEDNILMSLSRKASGDARASINDFQTLIRKEKELKIDSSELDYRNKTEHIKSALNKIFKTTDSKIALEAFASVEEDLDAQILWIDENLPKEYKKAKDLALAYEKLSTADVFKGRITRWQHYRFLVYVNELITAGIALSKDKKYSSISNYQPTSRLLKMWRAKQKSLKKKAIASKLAEKLHSSSKLTLKNTMPYLELFLKKNDEFANNLIKELDLSDEEIDWIKSQK